MPIKNDHNNQGSASRTCGDRTAAMGIAAERGIKLNVEDKTTGLFFRWLHQSIGQRKAHT